MNTDVATIPLGTSQPTSVRARMAGLYGLKPWFTRRLTPVVHAAVVRQISPDVFTAAGVAAAGAAGAAVAFGCWPLAALFMVLRLAGANLDGAVARARGVSRPWGFVVNEIGDRTSDLLAFAGLAVWAARQGGPGLNWLSWPVLQVSLAALAATLPTFASLAAGAAGATRRNGGPLGKTERCLFVVLASAIPAIMPILLMQLVNGSLITTVLRLRAAHRELKAQRAEAVRVRQTHVVRPRRIVAERLDAMTVPNALHMPLNAVHVPLNAVHLTAVSPSAPTRPMRQLTHPSTAVTRPLRGVAA